MNVLCIGAHPDDIEIGCAGAVLQHTKRGDNVYFAIATNGVLGGHKRYEAETAAKALGVKECYLLDYVDGRIPITNQLVDELEQIIRLKNIDRVYSHSEKESHQDHRAVHYATLAAARKVPQRLFYEGPSTLVFHPSYFIELDYDDQLAKRAVLEIYQTQMQKNSFVVDSVFDKHRVHAAVSCREMGVMEAFEIGCFVQ